MSVSVFSFIIIENIIIPPFTPFVGCFANILFRADFTGNKIDNRHSIAIKFVIYLKGFARCRTGELFCQIQSITNIATIVVAFKCPFLFNQWW